MNTVMTGAEDAGAMEVVGMQAEANASTKRQRRSEEQVGTGEGAPCGPQREGEQELPPPQQWSTLEAGLARTKMQVVFSMDEPFVVVGNLYWTLRDFEREILNYCSEQGARFENDRLDAIGTNKIVLIGRPSTKTKELWWLLKCGYIRVQGVQIWMQPSFTGRKVPNLSLCEVEYLNTNEVQPSELVNVIQGWGGTDAIVVSHAFNVGAEEKWPAIMCLRNMSRTSPELLFVFRLFFPSADEANTVYGNYLKERRALDPARNRAEGTLTLKPEPTALEHASFVECRVIVTGFSAEVPALEIKEAFEKNDLGRVTVEIRGPRRNYAVAELANRSAVEEALTRFGEEATDALRVENIVLRVKKLNDQYNQGCFKCGQLGHFKRTCPELRSKSGNDSNATVRPNSLLISAANGNQAAIRLVESMVEGIITKRSTRPEQQLAQVHNGVTALTNRVAATEARQQAMEGQMAVVVASLEQKWQLP